MQAGNYSVVRTNKQTNKPKKMKERKLGVKRFKNVENILKSSIGRLIAKLKINK